MVQKTLVIARKPQVCWRGFTDPDTLSTWVPGLRSATVIAKQDDGFPREILFELASGRRYTLAYSYESTSIARTVRWTPRGGSEHAVSGSARFEPHEQGTLITYELEHGPSRTEVERAVASADEVLDAFAWWIADQEERPTKR